jgi:hypothetical protein
MPATAQISSLSEASPDTPTAPSTVPSGDLISTPPATGTARPPARSDSALVKPGTPVEAERHRAERLALGNLRPHQRGAILTQHRLEMSTGIQHHDRKRRERQLTPLGERLLRDDERAAEADAVVETGRCRMGHGGRSSEIQSSVPPLPGAVKGERSVVGGLLAVKHPKRARRVWSTG